MDVCEFYPVTVTVGRDGRPRSDRGPVCLKPATADGGTRCDAHQGLETGADLLEHADTQVDLVASLRARMADARQEG